jgi:hypothetical protein
MDLTIRDLEQQYRKRGDNTRGIQIWSNLNWSCLAITLLKALFCKEDFLQEEETKIHDRARMTLVYCFFFEDVVFEEAGLLVLSW